VLCLQCNTCKAVIVTTAIHNWKAVAGLNVTFLVLLCISYSLSAAPSATTTTVGTTTEHPFAVAFVYGKS
jgi:hypothetical protein